MRKALTAAWHEFWRVLRTERHAKQDPTKFDSVPF